MCLEAGKLFHIHLNSQDGQRYDQDLPFGYTEPLKDLALLVVLQDAKYAGPICFDVKAPRVDDPANIQDVLTVSSKTSSGSGSARSKWIARRSSSSARRTASRH